MQRPGAPSRGFAFLSQYVTDTLRLAQYARPRRGDPQDDASAPEAPRRTSRALRARARFGAVTALLWEFADYLTFVRTNEDELRTAYTDTLGDLALGLAGSIVAALVTISALGRATPGASRAGAR